MHAHLHPLLEEESVMHSRAPRCIYAFASSVGVSLSNNNSFNSANSTVTVAEQGQSSSMNEHLNAQMVESADAMDGGLASPSSVENSNVINIEAELQELIYGEANQVRAAGAIDECMQQGDMDWWSYDQSKPVNCWDFTPEPNPVVFQDYASVYDI